MIGMRDRLKDMTRFLWAAAPQFVAITPPNSGGDSLVSGLFGSGSTSLASMLNTAFLVAINVGAILAMLRIMWAGWLYMGSADMWSNKHHAKEVFQNAIIGLLVLLAVYLILYQINPQILNVGQFDTDIPQSGVPTS